MSELTATNCGCGCDNGCTNSCGCGGNGNGCGLNNSCLWIILLLCCCGGWGGNGCGGCGNGCGNDSCLWIILLLCCCGGWGNNGFGCGGCGNGCNCGGCWYLFLLSRYCSHDVRPATHLAILNRLWRWGEMHSSQNTHPPCQSAEWLTREWTVTNKFHILYRKSGIHRRTGWDGGNVGKPGSVSCVIAIRDWIEGLSAFADPSRRYIEF